MANNNSLRIIGGDWRSRRIQFINSAKIRPTPDRVRETLFNWLAMKINGARCLDLFAGSGALGFEALSRGAKQVVMVEKDAKISAMLHKQKEIFAAQGLDIKPQSAQSYLQSASQQFDIIFLDPPFNTDLLAQSIPIVLERQLLTDNGVLYIESPSIQTMTIDMEKLSCIREKVSGEVRYALYELVSA